jgi:TolB-like protein
MNQVETTMHFGTFEVDLQSRELRKNGMRMRMEEKPFQILEMLLDHAGQVVTRKLLRERLWPDTHVGYEHSLNTAINKLRELLGDSAQSPRFVETLPRVGYRFIAPVTKPGRASSRGGKKMLVVLPLENLSGIPEQEYFADGLTEEMIAHLGQLNPKRLGVIARTSSNQFKATKKSIAQIADELQVDYVLEGSVRREGRRVRITVQLIETQDQAHLWSATYDRDLRDVLGMQADVARQVGKALAFELLPGNRRFLSPSIRMLTSSIFADDSILASGPWKVCRKLSFRLNRRCALNPDARVPCLASRTAPACYPGLEFFRRKKQEFARERRPRAPLRSILLSANRMLRWVWSNSGTSGIGRPPKQLFSAPSS